MTGFHCKDPGAHRANGSWIVTRRNYRCSAFDGYRQMWSPYSDVYCQTCGRLWRTRAKYVDTLPNGKMT